MVINQVTASAEPNSKSNVSECEYWVGVATCQCLATIAGEEGMDTSDLRTLFGPFTYVEARAFIVSAFRGGLDINAGKGTMIHDATMFVQGDESDDYEDYIVETWKADHYIDTDCSKFEKHEADQL